MDQSILFENDAKFDNQKQSLPVLSVKPGQEYPNQKAWTRPFLYPSLVRNQSMCKKIDEAFVMHYGKKSMKIQEDPWENYLYHDSKYVLPLICHRKSLTVEEQVIVSMFILHTI